MSFNTTNTAGTEMSLIVYLRLQHCISCGVPFAMPTDLDEEYRRNHKNFYCPNGHQQHYSGKTEAEKLKIELDRVKQEKEHQERCRERAENMYRKSETERKKVKTRLRNVKAKIAEGLCPCCDQAFPDLHAHMSAAHPDFKTIEAE
jgi:hypothetical protein